MSGDITGCHDPEMGVVLLASRGWRPNILQCTGQPQQQRSVTPEVHSAGVGKAWTRRKLFSRACSRPGVCSEGVGDTHDQSVEP